MYNNLKLIYYIVKEKRLADIAQKIEDVMTGEVKLKNPSLVLVGLETLYFMVDNDVIKEKYYVK